MCNHVILSAVKRSPSDSLRSLEVNSTKSKDRFESIERHPSGRLDPFDFAQGKTFARHGKQITVAE
jgi:hypothetical protein